MKLPDKICNYLVQFFSNKYVIFDRPDWETVQQLIEYLLNRPTRPVDDYTLAVFEKEFIEINKIQDHSYFEKFTDFIFQISQINKMFKEMDYDFYLEKNSTGDYLVYLFTPPNIRDTLISKKPGTFIVYLSKDLETDLETNTATNPITNPATNPIILQENKMEITSNIIGRFHM